MSVPLYAGDGFTPSFTDKTFSSTGDVFKVIRSKKAKFRDRDEIQDLYTPLTRSASDDYFT